jgi:hypothetical protein
LEHCFDQCLKSPEKLPPAFASVAAEDSLLRAAGDFVATLTDRAVLEAWRPG